MILEKRFRILTRLIKSFMELYLFYFLLFMFKTRKNILIINYIFLTLDGLNIVYCIYVHRATVLITFLKQYFHTIYNILFVVIFISLLN